MTGFSATDAALEGFRLTRERPRALLAWTGFCFAQNVVSVLITVNLPKEVRDAFESLQPNPEQAPDFDSLMQALVLLSPILAFGLAVQCIMAAAVYRIILRPEAGPLGGLHLGKDELRLMMLTLIYLVLGVMLLAVAQLAIGIVTFLASILGQAAVAFVFSVSELFVLGLFFYVAIRMSLAPVITFDKRRLAILDSWKVTQGQFWRLLGAYILAICCIVVVSLLALMLFGMVAGIVILSLGGSTDELTRIFAPDETSLSTYLNPYMIAYMVVGSVFTAIYYAVIAAPGAWAYRELSGRGGDETAAAAAI